MQEHRASPPAIAIELSQREGSVVACNGAGGVATRRFSAGQKDRDLLLPAIDEVVREVGLVPRELELVGVDIGPGGFTGLRISISTAQAIGEATGAALVGVDGAVVAAASTHESRGFDGRVAVFLAGKNDSAWMACLTRNGEEWEEVIPSGIVRTIPDCQVGIALADEHLPEGLRSELHGAGIAIVPPAHDATCVLAQARLLHSVGRTTLPEELQPKYPREPEAVRKWRNLR